jgi:hypothetical protein
VYRQREEREREREQMLREKRKAAVKAAGGWLAGWLIQPPVLFNGQRLKGV